MKPAELLQRLRTLSQAGGAIEPAIIAPLLATAAVQTIDRTKNFVAHTNGNDPHVVTCQDLRDFVDWIERNHIP